MKSFISILGLCFFLVSCGWSTTTDSSGTQTINTDTTASSVDCETQAQSTGEKLVTANENPDVSLEFLWHAEIDETCYLKTKITQTVGEESLIIFTLFDTATEQSYKNYNDEKQMELDIIELKG